jgi:hypothetical protein
MELVIIPSLLGWLLGWVVFGKVFIKKRKSRIC